MKRSRRLVGGLIQLAREAYTEGTPLLCICEYILSKREETHFVLGHESQLNPRIFSLNKV